MVSAKVQLKRFAEVCSCLNPYYTGRWFLLRELGCIDMAHWLRLNPYYTGRWFLLTKIKGTKNL